MYSFLFIIPNWVMDVNVVQRKNSGAWQHSTYFIWRQNKEHKSLFFQPAFLALPNSTQTGSS